MSKIQVTNINDLSDNASLITQNGGIKSDKLTGVTTAGSILVTGEGNSTTTNLQQGLAKAWCNLNGTGTIAIRDSLNIASATDNGLGHYTFNISNDMGNANYAVTFGSSAANSVNDGGWLGIKHGTTNASGSFIVITDGRTVGEYDPLYTIVSVLGDLA